MEADVHTDLKVVPSVKETAFIRFPDKLACLGSIELGILPGSRAKASQRRLEMGLHVVEFSEKFYF